MKANNKTIYQAMAAVDEEFKRSEQLLFDAYPSKERFDFARELLEIECMDRKETLRKLLEVA